MYLYIVFSFVSILGSVGLFLLPAVSPDPLSSSQQKGDFAVADGDYEDEASLATFQGTDEDNAIGAYYDEGSADAISEHVTVVSEADPLVTNCAAAEAARIPTWRSEGKRERFKHLTLYRRIMGMARLLRKPTMLLLVPFILYTGAQQGFALGDFTRSIIRSTAGVEAVGFVVALQSLVAAIFSWLFGMFADRVGTRPLFALGFITYGSFAAFWIAFLRVPAVSVIVSEWSVFVLLAWAAVLGLGDAAVANVFCNSVFVSLFTTADTVEAAFSNLKFWQSLGVALALFLSPMLKLEAKLVALLAALIVGTFGVTLLDCCVRSLSHTALSPVTLLPEDTEEPGKETREVAAES